MALNCLKFELASAIRTRRSSADSSAAEERASSSWMSSAAVVGYTSLAAVALEEAFSAPAPSPSPASNEPMEVEAVEEDEELSDAISKEDSDGHPAEEVVEWSSIPVMMPHGETKQVAARTTRSSWARRSPASPTYVSAFR